MTIKEQMMTTIYRVTKVFTSGVLKGLTLTEYSTVKFTVGKHYTPCVGCSAYQITACVEEEQEPQEVSQ